MFVMWVDENTVIYWLFMLVHSALPDVNKYNFFNFNNVEIYIN